jgi:hypothetical protein
MPDDILQKLKAKIEGSAKKEKSEADDSVARVLDDEFKTLGYPSHSRLSILGDVGRENNWKRSVIFGGHKDPKNGESNRGIISWQKDRRKKLDDYLSKEGVLGKADDDELRAMARFMDTELEQTYPDAHKTLKSAKSTADASNALRKYINYSLEPKYNTPDPEFATKHNRDWALRAKSLGLAADDGPTDPQAELYKLLGKKPTTSAPAPQPEAPRGPILPPDTPFYSKPETQNLQPKQPEQLAPEDLAKKSGLTITNQLGDQTYAKDEKGEYYQLDELAREWRPLKPQPTRLKLSDGTELEEAPEDKAKPLPKGFKRLKDKKGRTFIAEPDETETKTDGNGNKKESYLVKPEGLQPALKGGVRLPKERTSTVALESVPHYEFEKTGRLKLGDGTELGLVRNEETPEGKFRFRDADGETYLFDKESGKLEDESLKQRADQFRIRLADRTTDENTARSAYIGQVSAQLADKYRFDKEDVAAWLTERGLTDIETGSPLPSDRLYASTAQQRAQLGRTLEQSQGRTPEGDGADSTHYVTRRDLRDIAKFTDEVKQARIAEVLKRVSSGDELNPQQLAALRLKPEDLEKRYDEYQQALAVGQVTRQELERVIPRYKQSGADDYEARIMAKRSLGLLPKQDARRELEAYAQIVNEEKGKVSTIRSPLDVEMGYQQRQLLQDATARAAAKRIVSRYGSATEFQNQRQKEAADEAERQRRIAEMPFAQRWAERTIKAPFRIGKGAIQGLVSESLRGAVVWTKPLVDIIDATLGTTSNYKDITQHPMWKAAKTVDDWTDWALRTNKDIDQELIAGKLPNTVGSSLSFLFPSLSKNPKAAIALYSTLQMGGSGYKEAIAAGADEDDALKFALLNSALFGWTETVGISNALIRLQNIAGAGARKQFVRELLKHAPNEIAEEVFLNEGPQTLGQNIIAQATYKPDQNLLEGLPEAVFLAAASAGLVSTGSTTINVFRNQAKINATLRLDEMYGGSHYRDFNEGGIYVYGQPADVTPEMEPLIAEHRARRGEIQFAQEALKRIRDAAKIRPEGESIYRYASQAREINEELVKLSNEQRDTVDKIVALSGIEKPEPIEEKEQVEDAKLETENTAPLQAGMGDEFEGTVLGQPVDDGYDLTHQDGRRFKVLEDKNTLLKVEDQRGRISLQPERKFTDLGQYREKTRGAFVPERQVTLDAQREAMLDEKQKKAIAVLYTDHKSAPDIKGDRDVASFTLPDGELHVNVKKFEQKFGVKPQLKRLEIESGEIPHEDLIGGKAVVDKDTSKGTAVVTTDASGNELNSSKIGEFKPKMLTRESAPDGSKWILLNDYAGHKKGAIFSADGEFQDKHLGNSILMKTERPTNGKYQKSYTITSHVPVGSMDFAPISDEDLANIQKQAALDKERFGDAAAGSGLADAEEIIASREEDRPVETQPLAAGERRNRAVIEPPKATVATQPDRPQTALEKFNAKKLDRLGYTPEDVAKLSNSDRREILSENIPKRDFFRKSDKTYTPIELEKPTTVELSTNVKNRLRKKYTANRLRRAGYEWTWAGKKRVKVTHAPAGKDADWVTANFEQIVFQEDENRRARLKPRTNAFKKRGNSASLSERVREMGGIRPNAGAGKGNLDRLSKKDLAGGLVNQNGEYTVEEMAKSLFHEGYLHEIWNDDADINGDEFLVAIEDDFTGAQKYLSRARAESTGETDIEDEERRYQLEKARKEMTELIYASLSADEMAIASQLAQLIKDEKAEPAIEELDFYGELSDENRELLIAQGAKYGLTETDVDQFASVFLAPREEDDGQDEAADDEVAESAPVGERTADDSSSGEEDSIFADEDEFTPGDAYEPDTEDVDLSFDFADEDEADTYEHEAADEPQLTPEELKKAEAEFDVDEENDPILARSKPDYAVVPESRLASGNYAPNGRKSGEGDIRGAYSGDKISDGKIRKPFTYNGKLYTSSGSSGTVSGIEIVPLADYKGKSYTKAEIDKLWKEKHESYDGYAGRVVSSGGNQYVITDNRLEFVSQSGLDAIRKRDEERKQQKLADLVEMKAWPKSDEKASDLKVGDWFQKGRFTYRVFKITDDFIYGERPGITDWKERWYPFELEAEHPETSGKGGYDRHDTHFHILKGWENPDNGVFNEHGALVGTPTETVNYKSKKIEIAIDLVHVKDIDKWIVGSHVTVHGGGFRSQSHGASTHGTRYDTRDEALDAALKQAAPLVVDSKDKTAADWLESQSGGSLFNNLKQQIDEQPEADEEESYEDDDDFVDDDDFEEEDEAPAAEEKSEAPKYETVSMPKSGFEPLPLKEIFADLSKHHVGQLLNTKEEELWLAEQDKGDPIRAEIKELEERKRNAPKAGALFGEETKADIDIKIKAKQAELNEISDRTDALEEAFSETWWNVIKGRAKELGLAASDDALFEAENLFEYLTNGRYMESAWSSDISARQYVDDVLYEFLSEAGSESATDAAHEAATSPENDLPEPTQAQKEAGNYKKGHILINGLDISIENPVGSVRSGKGWSVTMQDHYGYIKRTTGADEEHIDVFVKDGTPEDFDGNVFVVDQVDPKTRKFDEHKVMLGYDSVPEAMLAYNRNYSKGWDGLESVTPMSFDEFKTWLSSTQEHPAAENVSPLDTPEKRDEADRIAKTSAEGRDDDLAILDAGGVQIKRLDDDRLEEPPFDAEPDIEDVANRLSEKRGPRTMRNDVSIGKFNGESVHDEPEGEDAAAIKAEDALAKAFEDAAFQSTAVECPTCKAKPGQWCLRPSEHRAQHIHKSRRELADEKFIELYGKKAEIDFDEAQNRWGVRSSAKGPFIAHATKTGRNADEKEKPVFEGGGVEPGSLRTLSVGDRFKFKGREWTAERITDDGGLSMTASNGDGTIMWPPDLAKEGYAIAETEKPAEPVKQFGTENKVFTEDKANAAREILRKKLGGTQLNAGLDPEVIKAGIDIAGYYIEGGARSFAEYARKMLEDLGESVRPYLKQWYFAVQFDPSSSEFAGEMDDLAAVDAFISAEAEKVQERSEPKLLPALSDTANKIYRMLQGEPMTDLAIYEEMGLSSDPDEVPSEKEAKRIVNEVEAALKELVDNGSIVLDEPRGGYRIAVTDDSPKIEPERPAGSTLFDLGGLDQEGLFAEGGAAPIETSTSDDAKQKQIEELKSKAAAARQLANIELFGEDLGEKINELMEGPTLSLKSGVAKGAIATILERRNQLTSTQAGLDLAADIAAAAAQVHEADARGIRYDELLLQGGLFGGVELSDRQRQIYDEIIGDNFAEWFYNEVDNVESESSGQREDSEPRTEDGARPEADSSEEPGYGQREPLDGSRPADQDVQDRPDDSSGLFGSSSDALGEGSLQEVRPQVSGAASEGTGDTDSGRSGQDSGTGTLFGSGPGEDTLRLASQRQRDLKAKQAAQRAAESVKHVENDLDNIRETLPFLLPEQQEDVKFAEQRFTGPERGVLFTNGTGTGKTYTGLGIAKRFHRQGKTNILFVAPNDKILADWQTAASNMLIPSRRLQSKQDNGRVGSSLTTYANFRDNIELLKRDWDLIIFDESHNLLSNKDGDDTAATVMLRAVTLHPRGEYEYASLVNRELGTEIESRQAEIRKIDRKYGPRYLQTEEQKAHVKKLNKDLEPLMNRYNLAMDASRAEFKKRREGKLSKVVFLSATPFGYEKNTHYAEGFLLKYGPEPTSGAYNTPDARGQFLIENFGYRMRYGKLTKPDAAVNTEHMEIEFNSRLQREGALRGRRLLIDKDYSRQFVLQESAIGNKIDEGFAFISRRMHETEGKESREWYHLYEVLDKRFNYLAKRYTLEAINAQAAVPIVREQLGLGRKIVIFHDYNQSKAIHPFDVQPQDLVLVTADAIYNGKPGYERFLKEAPEFAKLDIASLLSPIEVFRKEFGDIVGYFNGMETTGARRNAVEDFNDDDGKLRIFVAQSAAGREGISVHDTTGKFQRVLINLGLPTRPIQAIQTEGRIYRVGNASNAIQLYMTTGTNFERFAFATTIAQRASTAENLALGQESRALRQAFIDGYEEATPDYKPSLEEGTGGQENDKRLGQQMSDYDRAKTFYFGQQKKTSGNKAAEGKDYFATPEPVGYKKVEWADQRFMENAIEPSAGHGAIARWFRSDNKKLVVEPSEELASRLAMVTDARLERVHWEDVNVGANKADTIVMNPPFGSGGKTAVEHLAKAALHLRDHGRIVATIPSGPAADKQLAKFLSSEAAKDLFTIADIKMPSVTFKRAATAVMTHILVLEKQTVPMYQDRLVTNEEIDLTHIDDINELFDALENIELPARVGVVDVSERSSFESDETSVAATPEEPQAAPASGESKFDKLEFQHTQKGHQVYVAKPLEHLGDAWKRISALAKAHGGFYSKFTRDGAISGFHFKTPEARDKFVNEADNGSVLRSAIAPSTIAPTFFSAVEKAIEAKMPARASADQVRGILKGTPGVKAEELEWLGIDQWLNDHPKPSKDELLQFVRENNVQIEVKELGSRGRRVQGNAEDVLEARANLYETMHAWFDEWSTETIERKLRRADEDDAFDGVFTEYDFEGANLTAGQVEALKRDWDDYQRLNRGGDKVVEFDEQGNFIDYEPAQYDDENYRLPGKIDGYREILIKMPEAQPIVERESPSDFSVETTKSNEFTGQREIKIRDASGQVVSQRSGFRGTDAEAIADTIDSRFESKKTSAAKSSNYFGPHFHKEANVLGWSRVTFRTDADGKRVLVVEEIQSDWHQQGRKKGYAASGIVNAPLKAEQLEFDTGENTSRGYAVSTEDGRFITNVIASNGGTLNEEEAIAEARRRLREQPASTSLSKMVPDAPFKKSWHELVFKQMLRYAAENGFDSIAWTTGDQQNERWSLEQHVDEIRYQIDGDKVHLEAYKNDFPERGGSSTVAKKDLADWVGQELAAKILAGEAEPYKGESFYTDDAIANPTHVIRGNDLKVGGSGMRGFYDKMVPSFVSKYVKQWGGKVGETTIAEKAGRFIPVDEDEARAIIEQGGGYDLAQELSDDNDGGYTWEFSDDELYEMLKDGEQLYKPTDEGLKLHSVDITDAMRESVMQGQPLFKKRDAESDHFISEVLPKAHTQDVFENTSSSIDENGDLEINEYGEEQIRRLLGEQTFRFTGQERDEKAFGAITLGAGQMMSLAELGRELRLDYLRAGYTEEQLVNYDKLLEDLDTLAAIVDDYGIAYVFDEDVPEEKFHQEDLRAGRVDLEAIRELKESPFWTTPGVRFTSEYPNLSDTDKASELAAKLATNQAAKYGWTSVENFDEERRKFLNAFADGILRKNAKRIESEGIDKFVEIFPRIALYGTTTKALARRAQKTAGSSSSETDGPRPASGIGETKREAKTSKRKKRKKKSRTNRPAKVDAIVERTNLKEQIANIEAGLNPGERKLKNRKFAQTLRENGRDVSDVPYIPGMDAERIVETKDIIRRSFEISDQNVHMHGDYDYAIDRYYSRDIEGRTKVALGIALIDHLGSAGELELMNQIAEDHINFVGDAAQRLQAASIAAKYDFARSVVLARKIFAKQGKDIPEEVRTKLRSITRQYNQAVKDKAIIEQTLADAEGLIKELEAERDDIQKSLDESSGRFAVSQEEFDAQGRALEEAMLDAEEKERLIENLKRQLARWKNKIFGEKETAIKVSRTYKELDARRELIRQTLAAAFPGRPLKSIIGIRGASSVSDAQTRQNNYVLAKAMEEAGKDAKTIWMATGWERGVDGKWRNELSTEYVKFTRAGYARENGKLDEILDFPQLFEAYPELAKVNVTFEMLREGVNAQFNSQTNTITLGDRATKSSLIHEVQHAIQDIEGFPRGGALKQFLPTTWTNNLDEDNRSIDEAWRQYSSLAGEVEARNAQMRLYMTDQQRYTTPISESEDTPREEQIIQTDYATASDEVLKSAIASEVGDEARRALVEYTALQIFDGESPEDTMSALHDLTEGKLNEDELQAIHADAFDMTVKSPVEKSDDAVKKIKNRAAHRKMVNEFRGSKGTKTKSGKRSSTRTAGKFNRLERKMLDLAENDPDLAAAAVFLNKARNIDEYFEMMESAFPKLKKQQIDDLSLRARTLRDDARKALAIEKANIEKDGRTVQEIFEELKHRAATAAAVERKHKRTIDLYFKKLTEGLTSKVLNFVGNVTGVLKGLSATGEFSMVFRQNLLLWVTHPILTGKALPALYKGIGGGFSPDYLHKVVADIRERSKYLEDAQAHNLEFSVLGDFNVADEHFVSRFFEALANLKTDTVGQKAGKGIFKLGGKAYTAIELANTLFGDLARLNAYSFYAGHLDADVGLNALQRSEAKRYAASAVNKFGGRGDIRGVFGKNTDMAKLVNLAFFSLRLLMSRPQSMYYLTTGFVLAPKGMRLMMFRDLAAFGTFVTMLFMLAGLHLNPWDDDFGKIKTDDLKRKLAYLGLTGESIPEDLNIDALAGMDAPMQWLIGMGVGIVHQAGALARGESDDSLYYNFQKLFERYWYNNGAAERSGNWFEGLRYLRGKASPAASLFFDRATGKDYIGRTFNWPSAIASRTIPLAYQQTFTALFYDKYANAMKEPYLATGDLDVVNGLTMLVGTGIGFGLTQYPNPDKSEAETMAWDMYNTDPSEKPLEQQRIESGIRNLYRMRSTIEKNGKDTKEIDGHIAKYLAKYSIDGEAAKKFRKQAEEGKFKFVTKEFSPDKVKTVLKVSTPEERPELEAILKAKEESKAKKEEREAHPKSLAVRIHEGSVDDAIRAYREKEPELTEQQKLEAKRAIRTKAMTSNSRRQLSNENYEAVKELLGKFPPHMKKPAGLPAKPIKGMPSLKQTY